jgi:hypothetical protein
MSRPVPSGLYRAVVAALCLVAAGAIVVLLIANSYDEAITLGYTAGLLLAFGLTAAAGISITGRFPIALVGWLCVVVAVAGFGVAMRVLWDADEFFGEGWTKATGSLLVFSLALALISLMLGRLRPGDGALVSRLLALTLLATFATATLLTIGIVGDVHDALYFRVTAIVAVLSALGTALVPVLRAMRGTV